MCCTEKWSKLASETAKAVDELFSMPKYKDDALNMWSMQHEQRAQCCGKLQYHSWVQWQHQRTGSHIRWATIIKYLQLHCSPILKPSSNLISLLWLWKITCDPFWKQQQPETVWLGYLGSSWLVYIGASSFILSTCMLIWFFCVVDAWVPGISQGWH